jgi:uncharacterized membrane protein YwzB
MFPAVLASIVSGLVSNGMNKVADAVVEKGVDYVQEKLGVELKPEEDLTEADVKDLRERAMQHEEFMAEVDLKNMQGARDMQIKAMQSEDSLVRRYVYYFITYWSLTSTAYIGFITFGTIPAENIRFADTILGFVLGTMVAAMFQFLLGSSLGSRKKDEAKK